MEKFLTLWRLKTRTTTLDVDLFGGCWYKYSCTGKGREREGGGGGGGRRTETGKTNIVDEELQYHGQGTQDHRGGAVSYQDTPPTHTHSQVVSAAQVGRGKLSSNGTLVRQPGAARHQPAFSREGRQADGS